MAKDDYHLGVGVSTVCTVVEHCPAKLLQEVFSSDARIGTSIDMQ